MHSKKKIFLYGYYGFENVGDDLLLSALISRIIQSDSDVCFKVRSLNPVKGYRKETVEFLGLERIMVNAGEARLKRFVRYTVSGWKALKGCSHLVFGGGTLFHAHRGSGVNLAMIVIFMLMARLRGARIYVLGVGVAKIQGRLPRFLMEMALLLSDDFAVRDASSFYHCSGFYNISGLRQTADLVFNTRIRKPEKNVPKDPRVLGVTLSASDLAQNETEHAGFYQQLASGLKHLLDEGWIIRFLSFQELSCDSISLSDSVVFDKLSARLPNSQYERVRVRSDSNELMNQFSGIKVMTGMRFHGHVLAAMMEIPFVGFGRDHKVSDLCDFFAMPFISMNDMNDKNMIEAVHSAEKQKPERRRMDVLRKASELNFERMEASLK